jgi:hypothetical protein
VLVLAGIKSPRVVGHQDAIYGQNFTVNEYGGEDAVVEKFGG